MPTENIYRTACPKCEKWIGIRPDQFGRRLRCPACRHVFVTEQPSESLPTNPSAPSGPEPSQSTASVDWLTADEANELARVGTHKEWAKAKTAVAFQKSQPMVFQALIQAVRNSQCEIVEVDSVNFRIKFLLHLQTAPHSEHTAFAFATGHGSCDVDMSSRDANANGHFDSYYRAIVWETGKYLMFVPEPQPLPLLPPPQQTFRVNEQKPQRRRRKATTVDGLSIAGFVCGVVGVVLSCVPLLGGGLGMLGIIFGGIGLLRPNKSGFAIASLTLGIVACFLSLVWLMLFIIR